MPNAAMARWKEKPGSQEKLNANQRAYYARHRERIQAEERARHRASYPLQRETVLAQNAAWRAANPEKQRAARLRWEAAHPEKLLEYANRYRVRKAGNGGSHSVAEWEGIKISYGHRCAYCGEARSLTRDHVIPISRGGSDDIENIVPACRSCNSRKNNRVYPALCGMEVRSKLVVDTSSTVS